MPKPAKNLARVGTTLYSCQNLKGWPYFGWCSSQAESLGDERLKHANASIKKIVVGITGNAIPMIPKPTINNPSN